VLIAACRRITAKRMERRFMRIKLASIMVDNQDRALKFYRNLRFCEEARHRLAVASVNYSRVPEV
jgi:hypothetical protein